MDCRIGKSEILQAEGNGREHKKSGIRSNPAFLAFSYFWLSLFYFELDLRNVSCL